MTLWVGIDPGKEGALAAYKPQVNTFNFWDLPLIDTKLSKSKSKEFRQRFNPYQTRAILVQLQEDNPEGIHVVYEELWDFTHSAQDISSNKGVSGNWNFATDYGALPGILVGLQIPFTYVAPQVWQKGVQKPANSGKAGSVNRFLQLFPMEHYKVKKEKGVYYYDGRAEAGLLAYYGDKYIGR